MGALNNWAKVSAAALVLSAALAGAAYAADSPTACAVYKPAADSKLIGKSWLLTQRDDGGDWTHSWTLTFTADGKWTSDGKSVGQWCQSGDLVIFGFTDAPHTVYRGQLGVVTASGVESWDGAGTGIFEMTSAK